MYFGKKEDMYMPISRVTLRKDIFTTVYDILNNNLVDPMSRNKQWIFSSLPDVLSPTFVGYPVVIISKVLIEKEYELFDLSRPDITAPVRITIYSTSNLLVDQLSDEIDSILVPSNVPQLVHSSYDEDDGDVSLGSKNVHFRLMSYFFEVSD